MEDGVILDSNSTISLDDCPPWTREKMELATNFTFWTEGIIQVMKKIDYVLWTLFYQL